MNLAYQVEVEESCIQKAHYKLFLMELLIVQESKYHNQFKGNIMEAEVVVQFKYIQYF